MVLIVKTLNMPYNIVNVIDEVTKAAEWIISNQKQLFLYTNSNLFQKKIK